jgi:hypothetical protein
MQSFIVEVDGNLYEIYSYTEEGDNADEVRFFTYLGDDELNFSCSYSTQSKQYVDNKHGIDSEELLKPILIEEIKLEISRFLDGDFWKKMKSGG